LSHDLIGSAGTIHAAHGAGDRAGHPAIVGLDIEGVLLAANTDNLYRHHNKAKQTGSL
jgi:hypothetical protein